MPVILYVLEPSSSVTTSIIIVRNSTGFEANSGKTSPIIMPTENSNLREITRHIACHTGDILDAVIHLAYKESKYNCPNASFASLVIWMVRWTLTS